jgi:hypothetical protein
MPNLSRRHLVTTAAALPALAVPAAAIAGSTLALPEGDGDAVLMRLWSEYIARADAHAAVQKEMKSARALYDAEEPPRPRRCSAGPSLGS